MALLGPNDCSCASTCAWRSKKALPAGQAIGRTRGGPTAKIHLICDGSGLPVHFRLTGGNVHDVTMAELMLDETSGVGRSTVADKGYDSDAVRKKIAKIGSKSVIPFESNRKNPGKLK